MWRSLPSRQSASAVPRSTSPAPRIASVTLIPARHAKSRMRAMNSAIVAISALPPLNGFVPEWLLFQAATAPPALPQAARDRELRLQHADEIRVGHRRQRMVAHAALVQRHGADEQVAIEDRALVLRKGRAGDGGRERLPRLVANLRAAPSVWGPLSCPPRPRPLRRSRTRRGSRGVRAAAGCR